MNNYFSHQFQRFAQMTHETRRGRPERFATDGTYLDIGGLKIYEQVISDDNPDRDSGPEAEEPQDGAEEAHIRRYPTSPESPDTFEIGGKEEAGKDNRSLPRPGQGRKAAITRRGSSLPRISLCSTERTQQQRKRAGLEGGREEDDRLGAGTGSKSPPGALKSRMHLPGSARKIKELRDSKT